MKQNDEYNPADYGDKSSGLSMDATVQESLTVQKEEALAALDDLELALQLSHIYDDDEIEWVNTIRKYIEGN